MSGLIDKRIATATEVAEWLAANGHARRAEQVRGIRASLGQFRTIAHDNTKLRRRLTPIAQARASEARRALAEELETTAALLERMTKIAEACRESVTIEVQDASYIAGLLRRAVF